MSAGITHAQADTPRRTLSLAPVTTNLSSTPGRLRMASIVLATGIAVFWVVAVFALDARHQAAQKIGDEAAPLLIEADQLYVDLAAADATASRAFLEGGLEPAAVRAEYDAHVAAAAAKVGDIGDRVGSDANAQDAVRVLNAELPAYAGEVASARANNRLGHPVGAAYLRDASGRLRNEILPAATTIYRDASRRLAAEYESGTDETHFVVLAVVGGVLIVGLALVQLYVFRRTHRILNVGLAAATLVVLVMFVGSLIAIGTAHNDLVRAQQEGSDAIQVLGVARILEFRAQSESTLSVIDREPNDEALRTSAALGGRSGTTRLLAEVDRVLASSGNAARSVEIAQSFEELRGALENVQDALDERDFDSAESLVLTQQTDRAHTLDALLASEITDAEARLQNATDDARRGYAAIAVALTLGALAAAGAVVLGLRRRIVEYR